MIKQVEHERRSIAAYGDPAGLALALAVAYELSPPAPRAPKLAVSPAEVRPTARRNTAALSRRRTVRC